MNWPVEPTTFDACYYQSEWHDRDFIYSPDGVQEWPTHHCKRSWLLSMPYISQARNAIDIGCRDGEYSRYLSNHFAHTYCFDPRKRDFFAYNVDLSRATHWTIPLGDGKDNRRTGKKPIKGDPRFFCLDDFALEDIDYIKIDTDGYEWPVVQGGLATIQRYWPLIVIEVAFERRTLQFLMEQLGYCHVATCDRGWDHVLIKK